MKRPIAVDTAAIEKANARYYAAAHKVQTGINFRDPHHPTLSHKGMRVGIDLSKADQGGLATLLIAKGVFTLEEYVEAIADSAEREASRMEDEASIQTGINFKFK